MIKAKKSLGQNFLIDKNILKKITNIAIIKNKTILEVGPGTGNLTSFILQNNPKKLIAIEKDDSLAKDLKNNCTEKCERQNCEYFWDQSSSSSFSSLVFQIYKSFF